MLQRSGAAGMKSLLPVLSVIGAILAVWVLAVVPMNMHLTADQAQRDGLVVYPDTPAARQDYSGLGLSLARAIAQAHQGEIAVTSTFGKGAYSHSTCPLTRRPTSDRLPAGRAYGVIAGSYLYPVRARGCCARSTSPTPSS